MKRIFVILILTTFWAICAQAGQNPTFRSIVTSVFSASAPTITLPAGHALNDILFVLEETSNQPQAAPTGYTEVTNSPQGTGTAVAVNSVALSLYWKRDNGSESAPTIADSGDHTGVTMFAYSGCVTTGTPFTGSVGGVIAAVQTNPSFTTAANVLSKRNATVVAIIADGFDSATGISVPLFTNGGNANIGAKNSRQNTSNATGTGGGWIIFDATYNGPNTTGTYTYSGTYANSTKYAGLTFVLTPAVSHRVSVTSWWQSINQPWAAMLDFIRP